MIDVSSQLIKPAVPIINIGVVCKYWVNNILASVKYVTCVTCLKGVQDTFL